MKILVLGGGTSPERDVSLQSSRAVREALTELGHEVSYLDPAEGEEAIIKAAQAADVVFPILHGPGDEDGVQAVLDRTGVAYLGAGAGAAALCMDKARYKEVLAGHGVPLAAGETVAREAFAKSPLRLKPFVLKPVDDGSSVGLLIAQRLPYDPKKANKLFDRFGRMLLEEFIDGVEITVPVLGDEVLPVIEIVPPQGEAFDYENKYNGATTELCPPKHVSAEAQKAAQQLAMKVHTWTGCRHLSRTDMIVRADGSLVVLETNTLPGMTAQSLYPKAAAAAGLPFIRLVERFVELARPK